MLKKSFIVYTVFLMLAQIIPADAITRQQYAHNLASQAEKMSKQKGKEYLAISYINEAIKAQPQNLQYRYKRAFILGRARLYEEAIREFTRMMSQRGGPHAVRFRADGYMALGDMKSAARDYNSFLKKDPGDGKVWSYLVEALALMGNRQAALEAASKGLGTGSHWSKRLQTLQQQVLMVQQITPHKPFSN